ncbi:uncharacterized protein [Haliotis cracherodii]|uniref:uncharacterized protein n=1 Tax=Haliotis cracherodii TaxID=6455 RepID=UPI0039EA11DB
MAVFRQIVLSVLFFTTAAEPTVDGSSRRFLRPKTFHDGKCDFFLADSNIQDELIEVFENGVKVIKFNVKFKDYHDDVLTAKGGDLFRPNLWVRSPSSEGLRLLMLDDNFEMLSLSLLGIGVVEMDVKLDEKPYGCMNGLTSEQRVNRTRQILLKDFQLPGSSEKSGSLKTEYICNMRIVPVDNRANFAYHCCHMDPDGFEICEDIHYDLWVNVLLTCILVLKILVVLYSPSFIPEPLYRRRFIATDYTYFIPRSNERITIVKSTGENYPNDIPRIRLQKLKRLEKLKNSLDQMQVDRIYELDRIHFSVESRKLLAENYVPVSIMKMIYDNIFRCKIRSLASLKPCCDAGICNIIASGTNVLTWFRCLKYFAKMILLCLLVIPWVIRLVVYYTYEAVMIEEKHKAAERLKTGLQFHGSLTHYFTPVHGMFVVMYIIASIDYLTYGFLRKTMKNRFKFVLRKCLQDMREQSSSNIYGMAVALALVPFERFGIFGFLLVPLYWIILLPVMAPILAVYTFPALNLSIRLFVFVCPDVVVNCAKKVFDFMKMKLDLKDSVMFQRKEYFPKKIVCIHIGIILMCLSSFWSLTFLLMECISFFVEVAAYTLIGIIVNSDAALQYITVIFLIGMYAKTSFGGVHSKYLEYHKIIRGQLLSRKQDEMKRTARQDSDIQGNTVFRIQNVHNAAENTSGIKAEVKDGRINWKTKGLLVFLNSLDQPFTPQKFFFETVNMNYFGCPGKLWQNTLYAFYDFMKIMVFLFFVLVVVLAFGTQFSTTNQMLATLAGGFVPFVFQNFFMKGSGSFTIDTESVQFVAEFNHTIERYTQKWHIADKSLFASASESNGQVNIKEEGCLLVEEQASQDSNGDNKDTTSLPYRHVDILVQIEHPKQVEVLIGSVNKDSSFCKAIENVNSQTPMVSQTDTNIV